MVASRVATSVASRCRRGLAVGNCLEVGVNLFNRLLPLFAEPNQEVIKVGIGPVGTGGNVALHGTAVVFSGAVEGE